MHNSVLGVQNTAPITMRSTPANVIDRERCHLISAENYNPKWKGSVTIESLGLPMAETGGIFSFARRSLHRRGLIQSPHVYRFRRVPPCQVFWATPSANQLQPFVSNIFWALMFRLRDAQHTGHIHFRTYKFFVSGHCVPHWDQRWLEGKNHLL